MSGKMAGILSCDNFSGISGNMEMLLHMIQNGKPEAYALVYGKARMDCICGNVLLYPLWGGTLVAAEIAGLPAKEGACGGSFLGFHIHGGEACSGTADDAFADADGHFNPAGCEHPFHAGDFPPLLENHGYALSVFYTDRFTPEEVVGRTVIIHAMADDFRTQPSGNSGMKIACGKIMSA
ncbi:copper/zinc superoxide dismutase [Marvinbryantia formatexigens DSM 14469]|uniref:Copper/zinc superoxide dismutase n=1 Tax=Marvinbryantia formatexigens DSM 14469 TaxID=478749 RepID=C6LKB7_9FIRM|nr:superoxide dismutase family protein [Marvinbryantia formatexigens]EET58997.1 copper/zinc superoxide dismutase [Marvinbryantia formatexigens DSM 14469]